MRSLDDLLFLESVISHRARHDALRLQRFLLESLAVIFFVAYLLDATGQVVPVLPALALIFSALWIKLYLMEAYFRFRIAEVGFSHLFAAEIAAHRKLDAVVALFETQAGSDLLLKAGVSAPDQKEFVGVRSSSERLGVRTLSGSATLSLGALVRDLFDRDEHFAGFVRSKGRDLSDLLRAAEEVVARAQEDLERERKWSFERISKIPSPFRSWCHGNTPVLDRFSVPLAAAFSGVAENGEMALELEEKLLSKHAVLIGEREMHGARPLLSAFAKKHARGTMYPSLSFSRAVLFDGNMFLAHSKNPDMFEHMLIELMDECRANKQIILVLEELDAFIRASKAYGDAAMVFEKLIASKTIYVVATASMDSSHMLSSGFEKMRF